MFDKRFSNRFPNGVSWTHFDNGLEPFGQRIDITEVICKVIRFDKKNDK